MNIRFRKLVYHVHMDVYDDRGRMIGEATTQQPATSYDLKTLPEDVAKIIVDAEELAENGPAENATGPVLTPQV